MAASTFGCVLLPLVVALISAVISDVDTAGAIDPGDAETGDVGAGRMVGAYKATQSGYRVLLHCRLLVVFLLGAFEKAR